MIESQIKARSITRDDFSPFGELLMCEGAVTYACNQGRATRYHDLLKNIDVSEGVGRVGLSIYKSTPSSIPFKIEVMERHPLGTQAFIPMTMDPESRYLVAVAPAGEFDKNKILAFIVNGQIGVNYKKGVWHLPIVALDTDMDFLAVDRIGVGINCDETCFFPGELIIE